MRTCFIRILSLLRLAGRFDCASSGVLMPEITSSDKTISVMQPYFIPYAGYFRLLTGSDLFVIYDCVQFQRRGWVHRNQLRTVTGWRDWLTLPLEKAPREVLIRDLRFREGAQREMESMMRRFPALTAPTQLPSSFAEALRALRGRPLDYVVELLRLAAEIMRLPWRVMRSSELALPAELRGQDRIIAICKACGATSYLNASGGRDLYEPAVFAEAGLQLRFLPAHVGSYDSIAQRLATEDADLVAAEIHAGTIPTAA
jgi:hypothetical protein